MSIVTYIRYNITAALIKKELGLSEGETQILLLLWKATDFKIIPFTASNIRRFVGVFGHNIACYDQAIRRDAETLIAKGLITEQVMKTYTTYHLNNNGIQMIEKLFSIIDKDSKP